MKTLELAELESGLRACLADLSEGEEVLVKDGGSPLVRMVKVPQYAEPAEDEQEANEREMEAEGDLIRPKVRGQIDWDAFFNQPRGDVSREAVQAAVEWAKGDR